MRHEVSLMAIEVLPVGAYDLAVWTQYYGQSLPPALVSVPEPSVATLLIAAAGIAMMGRRINAGESRGMCPRY